MGSDLLSTCDFTKCYPRGAERCLAYSTHSAVNWSSSGEPHLIPRGSPLSLLRPHHGLISRRSSRALGRGPDAEPGLFTLWRALGRAAGAVPGRARE